MLASLPTELPLATRRQTVRVSLEALGKAVGATPETIAADASRKRGALAACVEQLGGETEAQVSRAQDEIKALEARIEEKRQAIRSARVRLAEVTQSCAAESDRLGAILEFFSPEVPVNEQ